MNDILDDILGLIPTQTAPAAPTAKRASKVRSTNGPESKPVYYPLKDIFRLACATSRHIGFECIRVETSDGAITFWGADGIDKTVFGKAIAHPIDLLDCSFAIGDFEALAPLLNDDELPMTIEYELVSVFKRVDPSDDDSETIEVQENRAIALKFGNYSHRLLSTSAAPKAQLKSEPTWNTTFAVNPSHDFELFKKHALRLRKSTDKVSIQINGGMLSFIIGGAGGHNAEIVIGACQNFGGASEHVWWIPVILDIVKCAVVTGANQMSISISKNTGLMKLAFQAKSRFAEPIEFELIIPGKIMT